VQAQVQEYLAPVQQNKQTQLSIEAFMKGTNVAFAEVLLCRSVSSLRSLWP
jgi:hypothetical protein